MIIPPPPYLITLDFETKSELDVRKVGADVYAQHPSTEILCMSFSLQRKHARYSWAPFLGASSSVLLGLYECVRDLYIDDTSSQFEAHNIRFERAIWKWIMVPKYGAPPLPDARLSCTMAKSGYRAVPLKLEVLAEALDLRRPDGSPLRKDMTGHNAMQALARGHVYKDPGVQWAREQQCYSYCDTDVEVEEAIAEIVGELPPAEERLFRLDIEVQNRGCLIDLPTVDKAIALAAEYKERETARFLEVTGGIAPGQRDKLLDWLAANGCELPNLQKQTVQDWLEDQNYAAAGLPYKVLELRKQVERRAVDKYDAFKRWADPVDHRARGMTQYHGATTGRWAGRGPQPQNFKRPEDGDADLSAHVGLIQAGILELLDACPYLGNPMTILADAVRTMIIAARGHVLTAGDLASIETHVLMKLAGEDETCKLLASGQKLYIPMAEEIYKRPIDKKKDLLEYTVGKIAVLQLGYQAGAEGFVSSLHTMGGIKGFPLEQAKAVVECYRREKYPRVPKLWKNFEYAAFEAAANPGRLVEAQGGVHFLFPAGGRWLICRLPSGRRLHYYNPQIVEACMPWTKSVFVGIGEDGEAIYQEQAVYRPVVRYQAYKYGQWKWVYAYGGLWTENIVQAISRDFLVHGMFNAEEAGLPVILTVHDEIVAEPPIGRHTRPAEVLKQCMTDLPDWGRGYPMGASCWENDRYVK